MLKNWLQLYVILKTCKSIAYCTQLRLADCLFSKSIFTKYVEFDNGNIEVIGNLQHEIRNLICASLSLNVYDDVCVAQSVWFGCYEIKCACILYTAMEENYPKFGEVISIIKISESIYFICHPFVTLSFNEHIHGYVVEKCSEMVLFPQNMLKDYHPHNVASVSHNYVVIELINIRNVIF